VYDLSHLFVVVEVDRSLSIHCTRAKAKHEIIIKQAKRITIIIIMKKIKAKQSSRATLNQFKTNP